MRDRPWAVWLAVVAVAGLALRIAYVLITKNPRHLGGDDFYHHHGANLLVALGMYYVLVGASVVGVVVLRRRRVPLTPLLAVLGAVALTVASVYGTTRFRAPAEVPIVLLGSVGLDAATRRVVGLVRERRRLQPEHDAEALPPSREGGDTRALRILLLP